MNVLSGIVPLPLAFLWALDDEKLISSLFESLLPFPLLSCA